MAHPFQKMFLSALKKSRQDDIENLILKEAEKLYEKGYRVTEIYDVLEKFTKGIVDDVESRIATDALEEFSRHLEDSRADK